MSHIILYSAISLDGFIAREDGSIDWLPQESDNDFGYEAFLAGIGSTIMGYNTYKQVLSFGDFPYKNKSNYVLTSREAVEDIGYVHFVRKDQVNYIRDLKNREERPIWLVGGGKTNHFLLRNGLIDRLIVFVMPVSLGHGIPLFQGDAVETRWILSRHHVHEGHVVELHYDVS
jgi:dihydrofolate reductase